MRRSLWWLCLLMVVASACGSSSGSGGSGSAGLGISPKSGLWQGSDLSFRLEGGKVTALTLTPHSCTGDKGCKNNLSGVLAGSWSYGLTFRAAPDAGTVNGSFISDTSVAGTLELQSGTCCTIKAAWSAQWVGDLSGADASSGGGGSDATTGSDTPVGGGGTEWGGNSFGTIHPGPALDNPSPSADACMTADQAQALELLNGYRNAVGAPVVSGNCALAKASKAHCDFYIAHISNYNKSGLSPHEEDQSYGAGFTGVNFWDRDTAAGFTGQASGEVIAFLGTPAPALQGWIGTVYHRLPLLSPTTQLIGYGAKKSGSNACDTIDTSARNASKSDPIIVYPWPGQHNVPSSWNGLEGPTPPAPPGGFPSGPVITAQFWKTTTVTEHTLTDAKGTQIAHTWLDYKTDANLKNLAPETIALYANKPLGTGTYTVSLTLSTGDTLAWNFTVGK